MKQVIYAEFASHEAAADLRDELAGVRDLNVEVDLIEHPPEYEMEALSTPNTSAKRGALSAGLLGAEPGEPRTGGGAAAREWIWGPEAGVEARVEGEPVRLWICAEQAYGDRLWLVATVVRRAGDED